MTIQSAEKAGDADGKTSGKTLFFQSRSRFSPLVESFVCAGSVVRSTAGGGEVEREKEGRAVTKGEQQRRSDCRRHVKRLVYNILTTRCATPAERI